MLDFFKKNKQHFRIAALAIIAIVPIFALYLFSLPKIKIARAINTGAQVDFIIPCLCSLGRIIYISAPVAGPPGAYMDDILTSSYEYYNPLPTEWVLGTALPVPTPCWQLVPIPVPPYVACIIIGFSDYRFVQIGNSGL